MADSVPASESPIQLPIFDVSQLTPEVGKSMIDAAKEYGFLYVASEGSDFTNDEVENAFGMVYLLSADPYFRGLLVGPLGTF